MRILHICPLYYPSIGGNQIHIQTLSERMAKNGDVVSVFTSQALNHTHFFTPPSEVMPVPQEMINNVSVHRFKINYPLYDLLFKKLRKIRGGNRLLKTVLGQAVDCWENGPFVAGMLKAIRRFKPDVMMTVTNYPFTTYICYLAHQLYGYPFVFMPITHVVEPWTFHPFVEQLCENANLLIACTAFEKEHLVSRGVNQGKIDVLPLGIDINQFQGQDAQRARKKFHIKDGPVVSYIGRKVDGKGIKTLIKAMRIVWQKISDVQLLLAGQPSGDFSLKLNGLLSQLTQEERNKVINIDYFSDGERKDLYAVSDIVSMTSRVDCFGLAYVDAWLSGKPVIACKNSPQETMISDKEDGFLINYGDEQQLAQKILELLGDQALRVNMGKRGKEKVLNVHNLDVYALGLRQAYQKILTKSK